MVMGAGFQIGSKACSSPAEAHNMVGDGYRSLLVIA